MPDKTTDAEILAGKTALLLIENNISFSTMESCTGGLLASMLTDTQGVSAVFKGGFVTYSNFCKELMGVPSETIEAFGVYSMETAEAMAKACKGILGTDIGIGITGTFSNPDPVNADSVPGEAYISVIYGKKECTRKLCLSKGDNRSEMKADCVKKACEMVCEVIK